MLATLITAQLNQEVHEETELKWIDVEGTPAQNWITELKKMTTVFKASNGFCVKNKINVTNICEADLFYVGFYNWPYEQQDKMLMQVNIVDTDRSPYYMLDSQTIKGEAFGFENEIAKYYQISFEEIHRLEESGECTNYGEGAEFKTYADCIAHEQEQIFQPLLGGCMVPWLGAPGSPGICKGRVQLKRDGWGLWREKERLFWEKVRVSGSGRTNACLKPCIELQAHSTLTTRE